MRTSALVLGVACCLASESLAQPLPAVGEVLEKMGAYLRDYESQLTSVVADEVFNQRVVATRAYQSGLPKTEALRRRLESEVGFIRLPGGLIGSSFPVRTLFNEHERWCSSSSRPDGRRSCAIQAAEI